MNKRPPFAWNVLAVGALVFVVALLSGCQSTNAPTPQPTKVVREKIVIPPSIQDCPDEPVYNSSWVDEDPVIAALGGVADAGAACRRNLRAMMRIVRKFNRGS